MTLLIVLASIAAYFGVGWVLAKRDLPRAWAASLEEYKYEHIARSGVTAAFIAMFALWPFMFPIRRALGVVRQAVTDASPRVAAARRRELEQERDELRWRVAQLERDLGIGGDA